VNEPARIALLDTNVLLLWLVGLTDPSLLVTFKRVDTFDAEDLSLLGRLLRRYQSLITTPHVLTEVSNFVDQAPQYRRRELVAALRHFVEGHRELYEASSKLVGHQDFEHLGISDTGLSALSFDAVVITTDFHLWGRILSHGGNCVNFNHLRSKQPLPS